MGSVLQGDCVEVMAGMDPDSVAAVVTDPPYGLEFMGKEWDRLSPDPAIGRSLVSGFYPMKGAPDARLGNAGGTWFGSRDATAPNYGREGNARCRSCGKWRVSGGHGGTGNIYGCQCSHPDFPNVAADTGHRMQEWHAAWASAALRVAKPGAYLLAFGGTRTVHRMTCALEDAGWVIRDMLVWAYASGFPKSKALLKPAWEPIVMARKPGPLRPLAIDGCRIGYQSEADFAATVAEQSGPRSWKRIKTDATSIDLTPTGDVSANPAGRWPANVVLTDPIFDGGWDGVVGGGETSSGSRHALRRAGLGYGSTSTGGEADAIIGDTGTYSRFFIIPKASRADREPVMPGLLESQKRAILGQGIGGADNLGVARANVHPTVKPLALMRHLVRLVTPAGGTVLDPFLGSGTTALAAEAEGFAWIGIEREPEYVAIAEARLQGHQRGLGLTA